ncbi:tetratricopeptide repeat protein [Bacteroides sp.]|uniref:tetratricopeptide repeat protein n=1 Tax=Bacteroides sp. TaxID=29523 RepID=UPI002608DED1|nr:tetratricopeptide repeat protein [Bacteroides sp.]
MLLLREYLPAEKSALKTADDYFFPSRDVPSLFLARNYVEQNQYAKAKDLLTEIVNSGRYKLDDMVYGMPEPKPQTTRAAQSFESVSNICFSYVEVMLMLSECEYRLGNSARAEEYLNTVVAANVGTPAYSSGWGDNNNVDIWLRRKIIKLRSHFFVSTLYVCKLLYL